jgi:hypothetical protein
LIEKSKARRALGEPASAERLGLWVDEKNFVHQELIANGRYDEARGIFGCHRRGPHCARVVRRSSDRVRAGLAQDAAGEQRFKKGVRAIEAVVMTSGAAESEPAPELSRWTVEVVFGDVLSRGFLSAKEKLLVIISVLGTQANRPGGSPGRCSRHLPAVCATKRSWRC